VLGDDVDVLIAITSIYLDEGCQQGEWVSNCRYGMGIFGIFVFF